MRRGPRGQGSVHFLKREQAWRATGYASTSRGKVFVARKRKFQRQAIEARDEAIREIEDPKPEVTDITVGEYLAEWLFQSTVSDRTLERYRHAVEGPLSSLAPVPLAHLSPSDVRRWKVKALGSRAPSTVSREQGVLSAALNQAVLDGLIGANPSKSVPKPKDRSRMKVLSEAQAATLISSVEGTRHEALYLVALKLGPRQGEQLALFWSDLEDGTLSIERSVDTHNGGTSWGQTKTGEARAVRLPSTVLESLHRHRSIQTLEKATSTRWDDARLVFPNRRGGVMRRNQLTHEFRNHLRSAGLPVVRWHDLRHSAITYMLQAGVPVATVSQMVGHKNATMTLNRYSHVLTDHMDEAARRLDSLGF